MSFQIVPIGSIQPSPLNPRKHFDVAKLAELAGTMGNGVGIIEPLIVRANGTPDTFELVAGERRWRAAAVAKLDEVPVVIKPLTDEQVLEIMVIENNQREDVNPLEEADGFKRLMQLGKVDIEALAERLGRSRKYVYDRIKLLDLVPEGQRLLVDDRMSAGHAILLARLKPEDQQRALDPDADALFQHERDDDDGDGDRDKYDGYKARSVRELERWIGRHVRFNLQHMAQAAPLEFGGTASAVEEAQARPGRGKKVVPITFEYVAPQGIRDPKERTYGASAWHRADGREQSTGCDHSVLGVVAGGPQYGRAFDVCVARDKCDVHWKSERQQKARSAKERAAAPAGKAPVKRGGEEPWQRQERERKARAAAWAAVVPRIVEACVVAVRTAKPQTLFRVITDSNADRYDEDYARAAKLLPPKADADSLLRVVALAAALEDVGNSEHDDSRREFAPTAKLLGIDLAVLLRPTPVQTSAKAATVTKTKNAVPAGKTAVKAAAAKKKTAAPKKAVAAAPTKKKTARKK